MALWEVRLCSLKEKLLHSSYSNMGVIEIESHCSSYILHILKYNFGIEWRPSWELRTIDSIFELPVLDWVFEVGTYIGGEIDLRQPCEATFKDILEKIFDVTDSETVGGEIQSF